MIEFTVKQAVSRTALVGAYLLTLRLLWSAWACESCWFEGSFAHTSCERLQAVSAAIVAVLTVLAAIAVLVLVYTAGKKAWQRLPDKTIVVGKSKPEPPVPRAQVRR